MEYIELKICIMYICTYYFFALTTIHLVDSVAGLFEDVPTNKFNFRM